MVEYTVSTFLKRLSNLKCGLGRTVYIRIEDEEKLSKLVGVDTSFVNEENPQVDLNFEYPTEYNHNIEYSLGDLIRELGNVKKKTLDLYFHHYDMGDKLYFDKLKFEVINNSLIIILK